jgi:acyl-CoA synthetase (AMP-forming)/AMP-acid ligase II/acyl carrier protein
VRTGGITLERSFSPVFDAACEGHNSEKVAIEAIDRSPLTYGSLRHLVKNTVTTLNDMGYGRSDRIALMLPNGPEMATAFLSLIAGFSCAPLNPLYREKELEFYLSDMKAAAIVVTSEMEPRVRVIARSLGIQVITLVPAGLDAGVFTLFGNTQKRAHEPGFAGTDDIGLILHTSGTTSRPKLVPVIQSNLVASAVYIAESLGLTEQDKCLNVMPLFHIHGLIGAVITSLVSGGSVVCTPGFNEESMMKWLFEYHPTWYTSVPTIHQYVLKQAVLHKDRARMSGLKFIRSSSASLPPTVREGLEEVFGVPVVEAYGMTEASHQISTNPLPPGLRKAGSVGMPTGLEMAILDSQGGVLPPNVTGEIALKGYRLFRGYENNPIANGKAFLNGWFLTGDLGHMDEDGYFFIDGRIKEMINWGGEKISPREVEDALLSNAAVSEAIAFSIPDAVFGEKVGAAVVLRDSRDTSVHDLKNQVSGKLAYFKVPACFWIVDKIPKGPTGKIQRIGMYDRLKDLPAANDNQMNAEYLTPITETETILAGIWSDVLKKNMIGRDASFFDLGGDSLLATMVVSRIAQAFDLKIGIASVMDYDTIARLGDLIDRRLNKRK